MLHNQIHNIVHSSAMYYQNLTIIHECSRKLLKMKISSFFNTKLYLTLKQQATIDMIECTTKRITRKENYMYSVSKKGTPDSISNL